MAAVVRLADMGFDRTEAAQAYLACDKNEALAANLLMVLWVMVVSDLVLLEQFLYLV